MTRSADDIIKQLDLRPNPEGGHCHETWVADSVGHPAGTAIYFLLRGAETNHWHKVDATEIWHFYSGSPLILSLSDSDQGPATDHLLGPDLAAGQRPQLIVPPHHWQKARCAGAYTLVGCTVSPGFQFKGFTLTEPGFDIPS